MELKIKAEKLVTTPGNCKLYCCGSGKYGNLGLGSNGHRLSLQPLDLDPDIDIVAVSCGALHVLALTSTGQLYAWGSNNKGQIGTGSSSNKPVQLRRFVGGDSNVEFKAISAGKTHSLALTTKGKIYAWGNAKYNGTGQNRDVQYPQLLQVNEEFVSISAGYAHSLALTTTGRIYAWGSGKYGQLGFGTSASCPTPTVISEFDGASLVEFSAISAGGYHSLALTTEPSRRIYSWGWNYYGQTSHGFSTHHTPKKINTEDKFIAISAGGQMSLALTVDGKVLSFGKQSHLGHDAGMWSSYMMEPVPIDEPIVQISAGYNHSVGLAKSGAVYAWGSGHDGQLGSGVKKSAKIPIKIVLNKRSSDVDDSSESDESDSRKTEVSGDQPAFVLACAGGSKRGSYTFLLSTRQEMKSARGRTMTESHVVYNKFKWAIKSGDKEQLVTACDNPLLSERKKMKGLNLIARYNKPELISTMTSRGCIINKPYKSSKTPLQVAAQYGSLAVLNMLLNEGAEVDLKNSSGQTALHIAAKEGRLDVAKTLVGHRASILAADSKGNTPFHLAVSKRQNEILDYFLNVNRDCLEVKNDKGQTGLHLSVLYENAHALIALCMRGANTEAKDRKGNTPLYYAVADKNARLIRKLLKFSANKSAMTSQGKTILELPLDPDTLGVLTSPLYEEKKDIASASQEGLFYKNLVFQGGGIKGLAYIGALERLYTIEKTFFDNVQRIGGTSAGAITAILVGLGYPVKEIKAKLRDLDFKDFLDGRHKDRFLDLKDKNFTTKTILWELLSGSIRTIWEQVSKNFGLFKGDVFRDWIESNIFTKTNKRNTTFRELKELREEGKVEFKDLYFVGTNLTKMESEVFSYETTPDMVIADAVRISMSIPFLFVPHYRFEKPPGVAEPYKHPSGYAYIDGGLIDNYPVTLFDKTKYLTSYKQSQPGDLPVFNTETLGFRLIDGNLKKVYEGRDSEDKTNPKHQDNEINGIFAMIWATFGCIYYKQESDHLHSIDSKRSVYIDHFNIGMVDFDLTEGQKDSLIAAGKVAVEDFIARVQKDSILRKKSHFLSPKLFAVLAKYFMDFEVSVVNGNLEVKNITVSKAFNNSKNLFYEYGKIANDLELLLLKDLGLSIYAKDEKGNTALHEFAREGDFVSFQRLWKIEPFKNIEVMNFEGDGLLDSALKCEDNGKMKQTVTSLVSSGIFKCRLENLEKVSSICQTAIENGFGGLEAPYKEFKQYWETRSNVTASPSI